jgi:hypothetical protein
MNKIAVCILFCGISLLSISQVKSLNSIEKPKEIQKNSNAKSLSEAQYQPVSRAKMTRKVKPVLRRENYEAVPQKD